MNFLITSLVNSQSLAINDTDLKATILQVRLKYQYNKINLILVRNNERTRHYYTNYNIYNTKVNIFESQND